MPLFGFLILSALRQRSERVLNLLPKDFYLDPVNPDDITKKLPRVTTILDRTRPIKEQKELIKKAVLYDAEHGKNAWNKKMSIARLRGENVHKMAEKFLRGEKVPIDFNLLPYWQGLLPLLKTIGKIHELETALYSRRGYAGRVDGFVDYFAKGTVADFKTFGGYAREDAKTGRIYTTDTWSLWNRKKATKALPECERTWENLHYKPRDAFTQVMAYGVALEEMGYEVEQLALFVTSPRMGTVFTLPNPAYPLITLDVVKRQWLNRLELFQEMCRADESNDKSDEREGAKGAKVLSGVTSS
jgi:hypothetical protein